MTAPVCLVVSKDRDDGYRSSGKLVNSPMAAGNVTGSVSMISNATNSPTTMSLSGAELRRLSSSRLVSLSFGNVLVGSTSGSQTVSVSKTGNGSVTISQLTTAGTGFTAAGMAVCQAPVRTSWKRMTVIKHVYLGSNCRSIRAVRHLAPARMLSVTMWFTTSAQTELKFRRFPLVAIVL